MLIGTLSLTGFPFLSGFYSKDAIIEFAYFDHTVTGNFVMVVGILTAFLTAIYSWRLTFKTFHGEYKNEKVSLDKIHESPLTMMIPLIFLAIGSIFSGFLFRIFLLDSKAIPFGNHQYFF